MSLRRVFWIGRSKRLLLVAASSALGCALWSPAFAQETTGAIQGTVTAPDGKPIADIAVTATMPSPRVARTAITDKVGGYRITALPLGEYSIGVLDPRFEPAIVLNVGVRLGQTTAVPVVRLHPLGSLFEQVEVVAKAPPIDPSSTTTGGNISDEVFGNLPVTRDYQSIAALLPSVSVSYLGDPVNFGGATGLENRYFVDGIDMTDPARGNGGTTLPPDFIQEVQVKMGGYEAEYRSALGGMVNVVTPTGGDQLSGKLIGYWTSHVVSKDPKQSSVELQQRNFAQYDVGFSLSGPLAKERAWYFIAYDPTRQSVDTEIPGLGYYGDSSTTHRFAGKIDWRVNGSNSLALTVVGDPLKRDGVGVVAWQFGTPTAFLNPDPLLRSIENGGVGISLRGTHVLSPRVLLESSISTLWRRDVNVPATAVGREEELFIDAPTGVWSGGGKATWDSSNRQVTAALKATWMLGRHELKVGAEYRDNRETFNDFAFDVLYRYSDNSFLTNVYAAQGTVENRIPSLFAQDSWHIGQRWTVNYGLRWAREELIASTGNVAQRIEDEWQPRIGFVYLPGRIATQRVYGSASRYYQELSSGAAFWWNVSGFQTACSYDHDPRLDPSGGDCWVIPLGVPSEVKTFRGIYFDEYSLGYQRQIGEKHRAGVRATYRALGDTVEDGLVSATGAWAWGNPGRGELAADYPRAQRVYKALEFTVEGQPTDRSGYFASYVLSENRGNYMGLYNTDFNLSIPNSNYSFDVPDSLVNADGLLPNDRTHVLKGAGFYRFESGLNLGASVLWQSGTPLNEFGGSAYGQPWQAFVRQRGTAGRTPSIFDLSLRLDYTFLRNSPGRWKPRLILDVYHLFSGDKPVDYDQVHYFNKDADGNQIDPNPT